MYKFLLSLILTSFTLQLSLVAQEMDTIIAKSPAKTKYLFGCSKNKSFGIYGSIETQAIQTAGEFDFLRGCSANLIFNRRFSIGCYANQSFNSFNPKDYNPLFLRQRSHGLRLEYTILPFNAVHISIPLSFGMTNVRLDSSNRYDGFRGGRHGDFRSGRNSNDSLQANFATIIPGINIEANLFRFVKAYVGASYRIGNSTSSEPLIDKKVLNGFGINAGIKVGIFAIRKRHFRCGRLCHRKHRGDRMH